MTTRPLPRLLVAGSVCGAIALALAPRAAAEAEPCAGGAWEIEYALSASLRLSETPMGQGDGIYAVGPGKMLLRFEDRGGKPGGLAKMLAYKMTERFVVRAKAIFWTTTVATQTTTSATPNACGIVADGSLGTNDKLAWSSPVHGYHTDGTLTCEGSLCGKFGAPPQGTSELHIGPNDVPFSSLEMSPDAKTLRMPFTRVSRTDMPKQTADIALAGREAWRKCVQVKPCK